MKKINRRKFVIDSAKVGGAIVGATTFGFNRTSWAEDPAPEPEISPSAEPVEAPRKLPDISVVSGSDYFKSAIKAIEEIGGISKFVSPGETVGLLNNIFSTKPGTYTRPDISLAVAYLCYEAGAKQVYMLKNESDKFWRRSRTAAKHQEIISKLKPDDSDHREIKITGAKVLKEANILEGALKYDRLINLPIIKNHSGVKMTCTLKNMMGLSNFTTNIKFHFGPNPIRTAILELGDYFYDIEHFSQSVADLNLVRPVDLCVVDATEFITTNGPSGPGELSAPGQVLAGTDRVAIDSYCARYLSLDPAEITMIARAAEHKLGETDLGKLSVSQVSI